MEPVYSKIQQNEEKEYVQQVDQKIAAKHAEVPPNVTIYAVREDTSDVKHIAFQILMFSMGFMFFLPWIVGALVPRCMRRSDKMHPVEQALCYSNVVMSIFSIVMLVLLFIVGFTFGYNISIDDEIDFEGFHHEHHRHFLF